MMNKDKFLAAIGRRISELRAERGISISRLAELAGISKSTLSSIESGQSNPTISTLWAIADALKVSFGELLPEEPLEVEESGVRVKLLERSKGFEVYLMTLSPGSVRIARPHRKGVKERLLVVRGGMIAGPLDSPRLLEVGEELEFNGDVPHVYIAVDGEAVAIITMIYPSLYEIVIDPRVRGWRKEIDGLRERVLLNSAVLRVIFKGCERGDVEGLVEYMRSAGGVKCWVVYDDDVTVYLFRTPSSRVEVKALEGLGEVGKALTLLNRRRLSEREICYLKSLAEKGSFFLSLSASYVLLRHSIPFVPRAIDAKSLKLLQPGFCEQMVYIAHMLKGRENVYVLNSEQSYLTFMRELMPNTNIVTVDGERGLDVVVSFGSSNPLKLLEILYDLLKDGGMAVVSMEFISPYRDRLERLRNVIRHHTAYMVDTLIEAPNGLTEDENALVNRMAKGIPLILYLAEIGEVESAVCQACKLLDDVKDLKEVSNPLLYYYLFQRLKLTEMLSDIGRGVRIDPYTFTRIAESLGFSVVEKKKVYATFGSDSGTYVVSLRKEG